MLRFWPQRGLDIWGCTLPCTAGMPEARGHPWRVQGSQILADQLTLSQPEGHIMTTTVSTTWPLFRSSDIPALRLIDQLSTYQRLEKFQIHLAQSCSKLRPLQWPFFNKFYSKPYNKDATKSRPLEWFGKHSHFLWHAYWGQIHLIEFSLFFKTFVQCKLYSKGSFTNYVDKILAFLTIYPPTLTFSMV